MTTRDLLCPGCGSRVTRTKVGMKEPSTVCYFCGSEMKLLPTFPCGVKYIGSGFHCNDYPPPPEQKIKDFGLERHDSTNENSDYHEEDYDGS